jgi:hypothetical protein
LFSLLKKIIEMALFVDILPINGRPFIIPPLRGILIIVVIIEGALCSYPE